MNSQHAAHLEARRYFDSIAPTHAACYESSTRAGYVYARRRALVAAELERLGGGDLVDVGCGTGVMASVCADLGYTYRGLDVSPEMVHQARVDQAGDPSAYSVASVESLGLPPDSFDVALALGVLEYVRPEDLDDAVAELVSVIRPGGTVILSMLNGSSPLWRARNLSERLKTGLSRLRGSDRGSRPHEITLSRRRVEKLLDRAGLVGVSSGTYAFAVVPSFIYRRHGEWWAKIALKLERLGHSRLAFLGLAHLVVAEKPDPTQPSVRS